MAISILANHADGDGDDGEVIPANDDVGNGRVNLGIARERERGKEVEDDNDDGPVAPSVAVGDGRDARSTRGAPLLPPLSSDGRTERRPGGGGGRERKTRGGAPPSAVAVTAAPTAAT